MALLHGCSSWSSFLSATDQSWRQDELPTPNNGHPRVFHCKLTDAEQALPDPPHHISAKPSKFTSFVSAIKQCGMAKSLLDGKHVHAQITQSGYGGDTFLGNCLVEMYGDCGSLLDAQEAFDHILHPNLCSWNVLIKVYAQNGSLDNASRTFYRMPERDVVSWSTMIATCARNGEAKEALDLYARMQSDGVKPNKVTFLSVLHACLNLSDVEKGQMIHATLVDGGHDRDVVVSTALVNMYGKCGRLDSARRVFHCMLQRDVVAWNAMISACSENQNSTEALCFFDQMQVSGVLHTKVTFLCVLDACNSTADLDKGHEIHMAAVKQGFEQDVAVGTALIQMYRMCGSLHAARNVFAHMPQRNVVSWNVMIAACTETGDGIEALKLFHQMQLDGVKPDKISFVSILDACAISATLEDGKQIHSAIIDCKYDGDVIVGNALINMYGKCGSLLDARKAFDKLQQKSVISWSAMMTACAQSGHGHDALNLFQQMQLAGVKPDMITFLCALDACMSVAAIEEGNEIHVTLVDNGYEWDLVLRTALINMYAKCGSIDDAWRTFSRMPEHDVVCWNTMLAACAQNGYHKESLDFFDQMQLEGIKPDKITFLCVLTACTHTGQVDEGRQHFYSMVRTHGIEHTVEHYACMVDLLGRAGHLGEAEELIKTMPSDKVESAWSSLLGACNIHGDRDRAIDAAEQFSKSDPEEAGPYVMLSNIYAMSGRTEDFKMVTVP